MGRGKRNRATRSARRPRSTPFKRTVADFSYLVLEWHQENNRGPEKVSASDPSCYLWQCQDSSCGRVWPASPANRTKAQRPSGCPSCAARKRARTRQLLKALENPLSAHPVADEWHPTKNTVPIEEMAKGSGIEVWWRCRVCGHEWMTTPASRTSRRRPQGCRRCYDDRRGLSQKMAALLRNPLSHHAVSVEWSERNSLAADQVTAACSTKGWWRCEDCGHEWESTPGSRTREFRPAGCPECGKARKAEGRRLAAVRRDPLSRHPVSQEWHPANPFPPDQVAAAQNKPGLWLCSVKECGHVWLAAPSARTKDSPTGCPACAARDAGRRSRRPAEMKRRAALTEIGLEVLVDPQRRLEALEDKGLLRLLGRPRNLAEALRGGALEQGLFTPQELAAYMADLPSLRVEAVLDSRGAWYRPPIARNDRKLTFERDQHQCVICSSLHALEVDHFWPFSRGGAHDIINYWTLCYSCNRAKRSSLPTMAQAEAFKSSRGYLPVPPQAILEDLAPEVLDLVRQYAPAPQPPGSPRAPRPTHTSPPGP